MTVRREWNVTYTAQGAAKVESNGIQWRLTAEGVVFLRSLKDRGDSHPFASREKLLVTINDVFDTLEAAIPADEAAEA